MLDTVLLTQKLIQFHTITPKDDGIFDYLYTILSNFKGTCDIKYFGESVKKTGNLYAKIGNSGRNLCFAGHVDVVPIGDAVKWKFHPFGGVISDEKLYGRGAVDMKGAIAAFIVAVERFLLNNPHFSESISILLTADEEGTGENGLMEMINYICNQKKEIFHACIIGEPTCSKCIGDSIKIGRRGSLNFEIEFCGTQGHVAYQDLIKNPITMLGNAIVLFKNHKFDDGNEFFEATNLEFVDVSTDNTSKATNVVPSVAKCMFNIRYNNIQTGEKLVDFIKNTLNSVYGDSSYIMHSKISNDSFLYGNTEISDIAKNVIMNQNLPIKSISIDCKGGTTDGRHMIKYCKNTVEIGLNEYMAHKIDEFVKIEDLKILENIYYNILIEYFK